MIYDKGVTLLDTWRALECLVDEGKCKAIGLSDVSMDEAKEIFQAARIKPVVVHVDPIRISHNGTFWTIAERMASCCKRSHRRAQQRAQFTGDPVITAIARRINKTPAQVCSPGLSNA